MQLSIVIPIYKSSKNAIQFISFIISELQKVYADFEIIFVIDNNVIDYNPREIYELSLKHSEIRVYQLDKNYGQHFATLCGYYIAKGDYILSVDEDMSEYIPYLCNPKEYENFDCFYLLYDKDKMYKSEIRRVLSKLYKKILFRIINIKDHSTGRIISRVLRDKIMNDNKAHVNIDIVIYSKTANIGFRLVDDCNVTDNDSSYDFIKLMKLAFVIVYEHYPFFMNSILMLFPAIVFYMLIDNIYHTISFYILSLFSCTLIYRFFFFFSDNLETKVLKALKIKHKPVVRFK